jgi:hypothetical protein
MESIRTALANAIFSQAILIHTHADVMDCEEVNNGVYLFDTVALLGKVAEIYVNQTPFLVAHETAIRLSVSCDDSGLSSLSLDQEFFDEITEDNVRWQLYQKAESFTTDSKTVVVNGILWKETEIDFDSVIHDFKQPLTDALATLDADEVNDELQPLAETIFKHISNQDFGQLVA